MVSVAQNSRKIRFIAMLTNILTTKLSSCTNCGKPLKPTAKFCGSCGTEQDTSQTDNDQNETTYAPPPPPPQTNYTSPSNSHVTGKEKVYYRGEGELLVRTTKHHGAGRKAMGFVTGTYLISGRDSKRTTKAKGSIVVTNKAIYCAGNKFDFDQILALTVKGTLQKKIHLTVSKDVQAGGRGEGLGGSSRISIELEISTKDINGLFKGLENARMADVEF